jgi:hypothetical protein
MVLLACLAWCFTITPLMAAATVTFTSGAEGTFPGTVQYDQATKVLTVDLSALPQSATIFRAEIMLKGADQFDQRPLEPTTVYPLNQTTKTLGFAEPRNMGLDALQVVREAVRAGQPLRLTVETTLGGVERLEVSYLEGSLPEKRPTASDIQVVHRRGQTMIVFREPALATIPDFQTGQEVADYRTQLAQEYPGTTIRIWRSNQRIDRGGLATARLIGECELLSVWNDHYYQDDTGRQPPVRYRVRDNGPPLDWGTGLYAHHPVTAGPAYYAVSVAVAGEEDLDALTTANCTTEPVTETVGLGAPILQWIERPDPEQGWHYRRGRIARLIYTRWEPAPHSSTPNNPIDYLVVIPLEPRGDQPDREPEYRAWRVDPALRLVV